VKGAPGQIYSITAFNSGAADVFVYFHNASSAVAVGAGAPVYRVCIPNGSTKAAPVVIEIGAGLAFSTGIAFTASGTLADAGTTAITAASAVLNIGYK
jgi:hypothetical protein